MRQRLSLLTALAALLLLLAGCGIQDALYLYDRIPKTTDEAGKAVPDFLSALPEFPVAFAVQLGDTRASFADLVYNKSLANGPGASAWSTDSDNVPTYGSQVATFGPVAFGTFLEKDIPIPLSFDIPAAPLTLPDLSTTVPAPTPIRLADTGLGSVTIPVPDGFGGTTAVPLGTAVANPLLANVPVPELAFGPSPTTRIPVDLPTEIVAVRLKAGSQLSIPVTNNTITAAVLTLVLTDRTNTELQRVVQAIGANASETVLMPLSGELKPPLSMAVQVSGTVPAGTLIGAIDLDNGSFAVGTTAVTILPDEVDVNLPAMGRNAAGSAHFPTPDALKQPIRKAVDIGAQLPQDQGILEIEEVELASGSLRLTMSNGLDADLDLDLSFEGLENLTSATAIVDTGDVPPSTTLPDGGLRLGINARQTVTWTLDLAGARMRPRSVTDDQGQTVKGIAIAAQVNLLDTRTDRSHLRAGVRVPATLVTSQEATGNVALSPIGMTALQARINRAESVPGQAPIALPSDFLDYGILPGRFTMKVRLDNASGIAGRFDPQLEASVSASASAATCASLFPGSTGCPATASISFVTTGPQAFDGAFAAGSPTATRSTVLELNERNTNLLDLIALGISELRINSRLLIGEGASVRLTRNDQMGGAVDVAMPLALRFNEFGPGRQRPGPPASTSPLDLSKSFDAAMLEQLRKHLRRVSLEFRIDNGWGMPIDIQLDFLKENGSVAFTRTLRLGTADGTTAVSLLDLGPDEVAALPDVRNLTVRAVSTGSNGQVLAIRNAAELRLRLKAYLGVLLSPDLLKGAGGSR